MQNQTKVPKFSKETLAKLTEEEQMMYHLLWKHQANQKEWLQADQRFFDRIYTEKKVDRAMIRCNYLALMGMKYAMEAETDFERQFVLPEAYNFICDYTLANYYHIDRFKKNDDE